MKQEAQRLPQELIIREVDNVHDGRCTLIVRSQTCDKTPEIDVRKLSPCNRAYTQLAVMDQKKRRTQAIYKVQGALQKLAR